MSLSAILQIIAGCAVLAAFPAGAWGYIFYKKQHEDRLHTIATFVIGGMAVFPILLYKWLWNFFPSINILAYAKNFEHDLIGIAGFAMIPLSVIIAFAFIGVIEEIMKMSVVHAVDDNRIRHIDDAIMFSILAALGFAFTENILYFYTIWAKQGPEHLLVPFVFRAVFSSFAHILFSAIFGYYYGIAHFAKPLLQEELRNKRHTFWDWYHKAFKWKTAELFHEQKMLEGLTLAVILHAIYNIFLEMNWTFIMVPYLVFGYAFVSHLFKMKENHKRLDLLAVGEHTHNYPPKGIARHVGRLFGRR
ncbi:PrsW family intramembrane metalloprotease [Candidatus Peregrinibacteria bacterium]|nr:PrsW family intramembrane metalloprotease [Candidatus Peregrinibacteria bacterium]